MADSEQISNLATTLKQAKNALAFTGAGISTESGIPDFRSKGGLWEKHQPIYFDEFMSSKEARIEYWRRKSDLYPDLVNAKPNEAHLSLNRLFEMGIIKSIITQNIDGLHQEAGTPDDKVIELHGNSTRARCMSCQKLSSIHEAQKRIESGDLAPECECGGYLKPDTVSFGQAMPEEKTNEAFEICSACDFLLVIGSTLLVQPASLLPGVAKNNGAVLAIINLSETPYDKDCDILIQDKAGRVMKELEARIEKL